ncbi:male sterility protein-domain-containing protein [Mycena sanguinolenta]|nr:male sterility protein-domain-containing protein [Mycena sanguinolenta]
MLATGRIQLVVGDVTEQNFGLPAAIMSEMADNVTLIIHAAGNISLKASISKTVHNNCLPTLWLAQFGSTFKNLSAFVYISTAYVNSFLPDGVVEEKIYEVGDAEHQLAEILTTGSIPPSKLPDFAWPYAFGKHLTERLLTSRNPSIPLLIVRLSSIGPAISQPYPYYTRQGSCPVSSYIRDYMTSPDSGVFRVSAKHAGSGSNIFDEIPVDLVSNLILLHIMRGTTGIVHACSQSYVPRSLSQFHDAIRAHIPAHVTLNEFCYTSDPLIPEGRYNRFVRIGGRDWHFSNRASQEFAQTKGPLSMVLEDHDSTEFIMTRAKLIAKDVVARECRNKL